MTQYLTLLEGTTETPSTWATLGTFLPFLLLIPLFYFLMYRPQKKQEKETAQMRSNLTIGDEVVTIGGIMGKVIAINDKDNYFVIETGTAKNKTYLKLSKQALYSVVSETKNPNATNPEITEADMNGEVVSPEEVSSVAEDNVSTENSSVAEAEEEMDAIEEIEEATDEDNK